MTLREKLNRLKELESRNPHPVYKTEGTVFEYEAFALNLLPELIERFEKYETALKNIAYYKKQSDGEDDVQTINSITAIAHDAIEPQILVCSEALKDGEK